MKTAYAITFGGYVEDIIVGTYDDAEKFAKEHYWDGSPPKYDGDFKGDGGVEIGIERAVFHPKEKEPTIEEHIEKFLQFGEAYDELRTAVYEKDFESALHWVTQAQCDLSAIATEIATTSAHPLTRLEGNDEV